MGTISSKLRASAKGQPCVVVGCVKPQHAKGWCRSHHQRWKRHGDPLAGRTPVGEPWKHLTEVVLPYTGNECLVWPYQRCTQGRGMIRLHGRNHVVSRRVCEQVNGPPPSSIHQAAHNCGNGHLGCVTPGHLEWKTPPENQSDRVTHGTDLRGVRHPMATLDEIRVREILSLKGVETQKTIAARFAISAAMVGRIHRRQNWRHVGVGLWA